MNQGQQTLAAAPVFVDKLCRRTTTLVSELILWLISTQWLWSGVGTETMWPTDAAVFTSRPVTEPGCSGSVSLGLLCQCGPRTEPHTSGSGWLVVKTSIKKTPVLSLVPSRMAGCARYFPVPHHTDLSLNSMCGPLGEESLDAPGRILWLGQDRSLKSSFMSIQL